MAVITITTQVRWSCTCGNMFGLSALPIISQHMDLMQKTPCSICSTSALPVPETVMFLMKPHHG